MAATWASGDTRDAPRSLRGILREIGPGLIISANIVGSGELIVTTKLGADVGFALLWFIVLGCIVKVFVQLELGRYAISRRRTTLQAMDEVPGPRWRVSWLVWLWSLMFVALFFGLSGMVGALAQVLGVAGATLPLPVLAVAITGSCALLLVIGRYRFIQNAATAMVATFSVFTVFAVASLYWTPYGITGEQLASGLSFSLPADVSVAFAAFGVIGVGAAELIYYPYWCLEKGYGRCVGPDDGSAQWLARARGWLRVMRVDALVSLAIYTLATVAFYLLGAAVLHGRGVAVEDEGLMWSLSNLYSTSFGLAGLWIFVLGSVAVLYSTVFISTASNARLAVDFLGLLGGLRPDTPARRMRAVRVACVLLPVSYLVFYLAIERPVFLVTVGAVAQGLMLPFLSAAALYFLYRKTDPRLRPSPVGIFMLWLSAVLMAAVGAWQVLRVFA